MPSKYEIRCEKYRQCQAWVEPNWQHAIEPKTRRAKGEDVTTTYVSKDPFGTGGIRNAANELGCKPGEIVSELCTAEDPQIRELCCPTHQELRRRK